MRGRSRIEYAAVLVLVLAAVVIAVALIGAHAGTAFR